MALKDLLEKAAKDPDLVKRLHTDPESVFSDHSLTDEEKDALKAGDKKKINKLLGGEELAATVTVISIIVVTSNK
jgi:hypothetical protein